MVGSLRDEDRAALFGAIQSVTAMAAIPSGYIAALLYDTSPRLPFLVILLLYTAGAAFALLPRPAAAVDSVPQAPLAVAEGSW